MKFSEYAKKYIQKINMAIQSIYDKKLADVNNSFLQAYYSELKKYFLSGGKRIRPLLCIAAYNGCTDGNNDKIIYPSVGVEFLHNASLIHDDIIDKDDYRRGQPAFHYRFQNYHKQYKLKRMNNIDFGNSIGIIGGDSAFFLGLNSYLFNEFSGELNLKAIKYYQEAFIEIANGVLIETDLVNRKKISIQDYIEMVSLKTGALLEKSLLIGANYAKLESDYKTLLSSYGKNLGIIFQITDDILGTFGDEKMTGKPIDGDIKEGKKTCLLIEAYDKLEESDCIRLNQLIEKKNITDSEVQEIKRLFHKADVINSSKLLANKFFKQAKASLDEIASVINNSELEFFEDLLDFVVNRNF